MRNRNSADKRTAFSRWMLLMKGMLIGTGAILPGISGGVLCVAMGVYQPIMALLAHPIQALKRDLGFYLPVGIGLVVGVLGLSRAVDWLFRASPVPAVWLFIGLIVGTMPSLWREAGKEGRKARDLAFGVVAFAGMLGLLLALQGAGSAQAELTVWLWLLCGVLWGVGMIVPGMSPSSLFIFLGVYQPMAAGIADLSLPILLPMGAGFLLCVLSLSRAVNWLFKRAYAPAMHVIVGVALASVVVIVPLDAAACWQDVLTYVLCFGVGFAAALWMDIVNRRLTA